MKKSFLSLIALVLCVVISMLSLSIAVTAEETQNPDAKSSDIISELTVGEAEASGSGDTSYSTYIETVPQENADEGIEVRVDRAVDGQPVSVDFGVLSAGLYTFGMNYKALNDSIGEIAVSLLLDGEAPFSEAERLLFPKFWKDEGDVRVDGGGNEFAAKQVLFDGYRYFAAMDITKWTGEVYCLYLTAGSHNITICDNETPLYIESIVLGAPENPGKYETPGDKSSYYKGEDIVIEAESTYAKSSYWLAGKTDNSSASLTPSSARKSLVNYIGGNWKTIGDTIVWQTPELEAGYYQMGFSYRQSAIIGSKTYRSLTVDGKVPFSEANNIGFDYGNGWQQTFFKDPDNNPYLIYLSAGRHEIALSVVPGDIEEVRNLLKNAVEWLSDLYIDMTMITGETVDTYRDYDLFAQIPDMKSRLEKLSKTLGKAANLYKKATGQKSGSNYSVMRNMLRVVDQMLNNRYTAHQYKSEYYTRYTSLAATLYELKNMPLDLDKIVLTAVGKKDAFKDVGFFKGIAFSAERFFVSFIQDYNNISGDAQSGNSITIWVNWGRDQAQVLNSLVQSEFTPKTNITVNLKLVNASIVQALLSGVSPDCILEYSRSEPVNLAMRNALYDLSEFSDLEQVLTRYKKGAEIPYYYKNHLYALPDTQSFYVMFYRKDILEELDLKVPETWDDFKETINLLARKNLTVWMPNNTATSMAQANLGIGSINIFPSMLLQKNLSIYAQDGKSTNLSDTDVVMAFNDWTDYYRKLKVPKTIDFYNRFRTGTCPIGISPYTLYTTLKSAAPEIDGLWDIAEIPGTVGKTGEISHTSTGGGTACAILKNTVNPDGSWEFLKWWTSDATQLAYSNELESILGPTGRMSVANVKAFDSMAWDPNMKKAINKAWDDVEEIPEYPGSYYVSRSVYQSFWNVVDNNETPNDVLLKFAKEADLEIKRKWEQYENR